MKDFTRKEKYIILDTKQKANNLIALKDKDGKIPILAYTYLQKHQIRRQRQTVKAALDHVKDYKRPLSQDKLVNYQFQIDTICDLTLDFKITISVHKVRNILDKYIQYNKNAERRIRKAQRKAKEERERQELSANTRRNLSQQQQGDDKNP